MIITSKLNEYIKTSGLGIEQLANQISRSGFSVKQAKTAIKNWQNGLQKPAPSKADIESLAKAFNVSVQQLKCWTSIHRYAPVSPTKARLVTDLVSGRGVQDALDILKFTSKRSAYFVIKVLKCAIADADEQEADVESLYIDVARVDGAGLRMGTKTWRAKDRGRAHAIRKQCCHIVLTVAQEKE